MKFALAIFMMLTLNFTGRAQMVVTNEVNGTFDATSYDTLYKFFEPNFASYFYDGYPAFTNHIYSVSQGGASWETQFEDNQEMFCLPYWMSFTVPSHDWMLSTENGAFNTTNQVFQWGTNLFNAPPLFWNGTAVTNEGALVTVPIEHDALGAIPDDYNGAAGNVQLNLGCLMLAQKYSTPPVDMYNGLYTPDWSNDFSGSKLVGFYNSLGQPGHPNDHPYTPGYLCMAMVALVDLGADTNVGSITFDWSSHLIVATNQVAVVSPAFAGNTFSFTARFDRMPMAWDVPDGTITNDARDAFVIMPRLGNLFHWPLQGTNLPPGNYVVAIDGSNVVTLTAAQLAAGWNMFTNYNGALWAQRTAVLRWKRYQEGYDPVTLLTHSAGSPGFLGVADNWNYQSLASQQYGDRNKRGKEYDDGMTNEVAQVRQYDAAINAAARQTNHTFSITLQQQRLVLYHR